MIVTRSPLRISIGGGGTDLPSYYREHGGFVIAAAIAKYVYITLNEAFVDELIIRYSKMERVKSIAEIQHPIIREAMRLAEMPSSHLEVVSVADMPAGTGLGSSGSFTTGLLKAFHTYKKNLVHPQELARQACHIEIDVLHEPVGKQDQYIAAYGGLTCFHFMPNDQVEAFPLKTDKETLYNLEDNLIMFFTGYSRSASAVLREQDAKTKQNDQEMIDNLHFVKELGVQTRRALEAGNVAKYGEIMHTHWEHKKKRSQNMTNPQIDHWYELARQNGAVGGKLIGAGGGGFLLFYSEDKRRLRHVLREAGLQEVRFAFDFQGTSVVTQS